MWVDLDEYDDEYDGEDPQLEVMMGANRAADSQGAYAEGNDIIAELNDVNFSLALTRQIRVMFILGAVWGGSYFISPEIFYLTSCVAFAVGMIPLVKSARIIAGYTRESNMIQTTKMNHLEAQRNLRLVANQLDSPMVYPDRPLR